MTQGNLGIIYVLLDEDNEIIKWYYDNPRKFYTDESFANKAVKKHNAEFTHKWHVQKCVLVPTK